MTNKEEKNENENEKYIENEEEIKTQNTEKEI